MKNILLLTDFSSKSDNAHKYAMQFHKWQQCTFYLMSIQKIWEYTMDDLMVANPKDDLNTALLGDNKSKLKATKARLRKQYTGEDFTFKSSVDYDVFTDAINQAVNEYEIELIVCGTDGKTGVVETIFSSHTLRIIRKVDCPVLVIPEGVEFQKPSSIQYLLDYDDVFEMCGKEPLIQIVRKFKSNIDVLRLTFGYDMEPRECEQEHKEIQKFFPSNPVTYHTYIDQDPVRVIQVRQQTAPAQLQVLSAHKQTFLERIFSNSHLSQIVNSSTIPLLILRDCNS
ncbi:universal stress protein [Dokdonia sinensis]|uniref:Universal stress protein n=1 Tax=Dokdonia sinensis TaxID=2479847 RepID=A0A3M0GN32_9FLAO|nr:universal stress protein [Dokdonia sinensis]RMB64142.1 universal stress protein [Dokdonia sinensis]